MKIKIQLGAEDLKTLANLSKIDQITIDEFNISKELLDAADSIFFTTGNGIYKFFKDDKYDGVGMLTKTIDFEEQLVKDDLKGYKLITNTRIANYRDKLYHKVFPRNWVDFIKEKETFKPMYENDRSEINMINMKHDSRIRKRLDELQKAHFVGKNRDNPNWLPEEVSLAWTKEYQSIVNANEALVNEMLGRIKSPETNENTNE